MVATVTKDGLGTGRITFAATGAPEETAAATRAIDAAFGPGDYRLLRWSAQVGDDAARRLAWATGFTMEGTLRGARVDGTGLDDAWVASLLVDDSRAPKSRWLDVPMMRGETVVVRELTATDGPRYVQTNLDPDSLVWLGTIPMARTAKEFDQTLRTSRVGPSLGSDVSWTIADATDDRYLGTVSLFDLLGLDHSTAEVGYRTHPDARGRGVVQQALRLLIEHAFRPVEHGGLGLGRLRLGAGDGNLASQHVARSCGFRPAGVDRSCYDRLDGSVIDLVRFDLLASDR